MGITSIRVGSEPLMAHQYVHATHVIYMNPTTVGPPVSHLEVITVRIRAALIPAPGVPLSRANRVQVQRLTLITLDHAGL